MLTDEKLAIDESERIAHHEAGKGEARSEVQSEIARHAHELGPAEEAEIQGVARQLKHKAVREVATTENELDRARVVARISQVVDYLFYLIYGIIGLEILLEALAARESSGFKSFIDGLVAPLLAPFTGLMMDPARGPYRLMLSYIFGLIVYILMHLAINGFLRMIAHKKTTV